MLVAISLAEEQKVLPFLVVTKEFSDRNAILGEQLTVTVVVGNYGQSPAFDVQILDKEPIGDAFQSKSIDKLNFGDNATLTYSVTPLILGTLTVGAAEVQYAVQQGQPSTYKAYSNLVREEEVFYRGEQDEESTIRGTVPVLTRDEYDKLHSMRIRELTVYVLLGAASVFFPFFMFQTRQNQIDSLVREAKKK